MRYVIHPWVHILFLILREKLNRHEAIVFVCQVCKVALSHRKERAVITSWKLVICELHLISNIGLNIIMLTTCDVYYFRLPVTYISDMLTNQNNTNIVFMYCGWIMDLVFLLFHQFSESNWTALQYSVFSDYFCCSISLAL